MSPSPEEPRPAAPDPDAWKLFVFRKSRDLLPTRRLLVELLDEIRRLKSGAGSALDALVRAGELETGLADAGSGEAAATIAPLVDQLASVVCCGSHASVLDLIEQRELPDFVRCAHPEGFSYYGLNPLDFADLARRMHKELAPRIAVLGIRSVGSTLGAVVSAVWRACGRSVERTTVRPEGEPYRRKTSFNKSQLAWIREEFARQADFVIVDEGPGFSGSTFLSVARALLEAGVPHSSIILMGSRPFPTHAAGSELAAEWKSFRSYLIDYGTHLPDGAGASLGGGKWRELQYSKPSYWPPCWTDQERIKHLSRDAKSFLKFEGFGRYGQLAQQQAGLLAEAGLSPPFLGFENGFARYAFVPGRPLRVWDLGAEMLARMAAYCAFRVQHLPSPGANVELLEEMMRVNVAAELTVPTLESPLPSLPLERPVYPDCRMLPHEWRLTPDGLLLKTDAVGHAEGHQLPGPADIAWDLAGTIIEWELSPAASRFFLNAYERLSRDPASRRVTDYLLPYAAFRMAHCRMAAEALRGQSEAKHLYGQYACYAMKVKALLKASAAWRTAGSVPAKSPPAA